MMKPYYYEQSGTGESPPILLDWRRNVFQISLGVVFLGGAAATYSIEYTLDPIHDPLYTATPTWVEFTDAIDKTTATNFGLDFPVIAVRLNVSAYTSGTLRFQIITAG